MKRNLSQKLIAIFLALGMLLSLAPTVLAADEPLAASEEISDEAASAETDATGDDTPNKDLIEWAYSGVPPYRREHPRYRRSER